MEFNYDNKKLWWTADDHNYEYELSNIEFADKKDDIIYVETYIGDVFKYYFIKITGELLVTYQEGNDKLELGNGKEIMENGMIIDFAISMFQEILVMTNNNEVQIYNFNGESVNVLHPPYGYSFYRFAETRNEIKVICQGDDETKDSYGRNDWLFSYNRINEMWDKIGISY